MIDLNDRLFIHLELEEENGTLRVSVNLIRLVLEKKKKKNEISSVSHITKFSYALTMVVVKVETINWVMLLESFELRRT